VRPVTLLFETIVIAQTITRAIPQRTRHQTRIGRRKTSVLALLFQEVIMSTSKSSYIMCVICRVLPLNKSRPQPQTHRAAFGLETLGSNAQKVRTQLQILARTEFIIAKILPNPPKHQYREGTTRQTRCHVPWIRLVEAENGDRNLGP